MPPRNRIKKAFAYVALVLHTVSIHATDFNDLAQKSFFLNKGWSHIDVQKKALLEKASIVPVTFNTKGSVAPSCSLIYKTGSAVNFIEVLTTEPGEDFPQCGGFNEAASFKMLGADYFAYVYSNRDLRDTTYEEFFFLRQEKNQNLTVEKHLNELDKPTERPKSAIKKSSPNNVLYTAKLTDGIALAKASLMQELLLKEKPSYQFSAKDFIADINSSFAIFKDSAKMSCIYMIENLGEIRQVEKHTCLNFLASSRFEKNGKLYFIAIYKDNSQSQKIDLFSIDPRKNVITPETELASALEGLNKNMDIKTIKKYLDEELLRHGSRPL